MDSLSGLDDLSGLGDLGGLVGRGNLGGLVGLCHTCGHGGLGDLGCLGTYRNFQNTIELNLRLILQLDLSNIAYGSLQIKIPMDTVRHSVSQCYHVTV